MIVETAQVSFRALAEDKEKLARVAKKNNMTPSEFLRKILHEAILKEEE